MRGSSAKKVDWKVRAAALLKREMEARGVSYSDLVERLGERGVKTSRVGVTNKVNRGVFGAAWLLQALDAWRKDHDQDQDDPTGAVPDPPQSDPPCGESGRGLNMSGEPQKDLGKARPRREAIARATREVLESAGLVGVGIGVLIAVALIVIWWLYP